MAELYDIKTGKEIGKPDTTYGRCKFIYFPCKVCDIPRWVRLIKGKPERFQCFKCVRKQKRGKANPNYKDGKKRMPNNGYITVRLYEDDFFYAMVKKDGYVAEHRLVMAKYLNRCLLSWEVVHHRNGIRDDNRIENLELIASGKYHLVDKIVKGHIQRLKKENINLRNENKRLLALLN